MTLELEPSTAAAPFQTAQKTAEQGQVVKGYRQESTVSVFTRSLLLLLLLPSPLLSIDCLLRFFLHLLLLLFLLHFLVFFILIFLSICRRTTGNRRSRYVARERCFLIAFGASGRPGILTEIITLMISNNDQLPHFRWDHTCKRFTALGSVSLGIKKEHGSENLLTDFKITSEQIEEQSQFHGTLKLIARIQIITNRQFKITK